MKIQYAKQIADSLGVDQSQVHLFWKGRVALFCLLKAMGVKAGDEVILPAYTCVVVPNAIIYLGAKPIYVDIDPCTFNMDIQLLRAAISDKTKVILVQNTFGLSSNVDEAVVIAKSRKISTIEDCTHGFGGHFNGVPNGMSCDAAFYSTQWNKPFSTGVGGFSVVKNSVVNSNVEKLSRNLVSVSYSDVLNLRIQLFMRRYFLTQFNYWALLKLYRYLSRKNILQGSSSGEEVNGVEKPSRFFKESSELQAKVGLVELNKLTEVMNRRRKNAEKYTDFLSKHGKNHVNRSLHANHNFLKYPLRVHNRSVFFRLAEKGQIMLGDWFTSPLHPVSNDLEIWHFDSSQFPHSMLAADQVVNLPTDQNDKGCEKVMKFLEANINMIVDV